MQNYQGGGPNPYPYPTPPPLDPTRTAPPSTSIQQPAQPPLQQQQPQHYQPLQYQQQQQPVQYQQPPVAYQQQAPPYQHHQTVPQHHQFAPQTHQLQQTPQPPQAGWHQQQLPPAVPVAQYAPQGQLPPQQQLQYGVPQPPQPAGTPQQPQPGQFPQHQYGALSQSPQPVTTPQQPQTGQFLHHQQQHGTLSQSPQPASTPQQPQPGQVPQQQQQQQQQQQYGAPLQPPQLTGTPQQQQPQQYGALPQHLQPAAAPSPQQTLPGQLPHQHQYGVPAHSPQTVTASQHSPQGQVFPQQQYGALPQPPSSVGTPQQLPPGQSPQQQQQQQQYGTPRPQAPGYPASYQYPSAVPTPHGQQPTTAIGHAPGLPGQPAPYGYGGPAAHAPPIPLTKTSTGLKSRLGATVAGFQSKLGTYMAKVGTPPSSAYPGAPGAAPTGYGQPYGQRPLQTPQVGVAYGQQPQAPQPTPGLPVTAPYNQQQPLVQGAQGQLMQAVAPHAQQTQPAQPLYGQPPPPYEQRPQPPQTQPPPAAVVMPQYGQQPQQSQQHGQSPSPYGQQPQPPLSAPRQTAVPTSPYGQPPTAGPVYGQPTQTPQGIRQSVYGTPQGYPQQPSQAIVGGPYPASGAPAVQSAIAGYPPQQTVSSPVSPPVPWQPYQAPSQHPAYNNAPPSVPTPAPSSPGTPGTGFPLKGTPAVGTPAMPTPVAHGQGLPQWTRHTSYDLSAAQRQQGHSSDPMPHQSTASISSTAQTLASEHVPAQPTVATNPTSATSTPAPGPEPSQYRQAEAQQQRSDQQRQDLSPPQSQVGDSSSPQHALLMQQPTHTFARKPVSPPSAEPPMQQPAPHREQALPAPSPEQPLGPAFEPSGPQTAATSESQQLPPPDSWSIASLTSQIQDLLVADTPVHPDPVPVHAQHQPHPPSAQLPGLVAISTNPYPVNGETVATDYFLHPMLTAPFSDTPKNRCCSGNSKVPQPRTWFFHPSTPSFHICHFCYLAYIAPTKFGLEFASRNEKDVHCHFHAFRITRVLWPQALASGDMSLVVAYMARRATEVRFCGGPEGKRKSDGIKWYLPPELDDKGNPGYCEACYEDLIVGGPFEGRLMAGVKEQPEEEEWYCTSWNNGFTRMILKGDWEQFLQHTAARFRLPACDGRVNMTSQARWWTLRGMGSESAVHMCQPCYLDIFKGSRWEGIVEECGPPLDQARVCDWNPDNNPNLDVAVAAATQKRLGADELRRILFTITSKPTCGKQEPFQDGRYYNFRGTPVDEFGICEACYEARIRPLELGQFFTDAPQVVPGATYCSFSPYFNNSGFFKTLFGEAVETGVWVVYEDRVRAMTNLPPCKGIDAMQGGRWWGWPDCTVCENCFQSFAFGTKFSSEMPLQGITGASDESRICGLFSGGQQKRYLDACENNKLDEFLGFCRERQVKWGELWPAIQNLQAQISSTYWAGVNLSNVSQGNKNSDAITIGTPTTAYISESGTRYNSHSGVLAEQQAAQAEELMRQGAEPMAEQKRLLEIWSLWE